MRLKLPRRRRQMRRDWTIGIARDGLVRSEARRLRFRRTGGRMLRCVWEQGTRRFVSRGNFGGGLPRGALCCRGFGARFVTGPTRLQRRHCEDGMPR